MAIIDVPSRFTFSKVNSFTLQRASNTLRSKFTGQGQRIVYPFAVWMLDATVTETDGVTAGKFRSFLVQLDGQKNTFRLPVPGYYRPSTGYAQNAACAATPARASSIQMTGFVASTPIFREGDYFTVNDELKMVVADTASNSSGSAVVSFKPALRKPVATGTLAIIQNPTVLMVAEEDDVASWSIGAPTRQGSKFNAIEAVEI